MIWNVFDPEIELYESFRNLPHKDQTGALTFVTFRLQDSMPREVVERWTQEVDQCMAELGLAGQCLENVISSSKVAPETRRKLRKFKDRRWHFHLDACHGDCLLRIPENANEVAKSILHFNAIRYDVERFVIMPNHVHVDSNASWIQFAKHLSRNPTVFGTADKQNNWQNG